MLHCAIDIHITRSEVQISDRFDVRLNRSEFHARQGELEFDFRVRQNGYLAVQSCCATMLTIELQACRKLAARLVVDVRNIEVEVIKAYLCRRRDRAVFQVERKIADHKFPDAYIPWLRIVAGRRDLCFDGGLCDRNLFICRRLVGLNNIQTAIFATTYADRGINQFNVAK